jgi:hypothetical protein
MSLRPYLSRRGDAERDVSANEQRDDNPSKLRLRNALHTELLEIKNDGDEMFASAFPISSTGARGHYTLSGCVHRARRDV